MYTCLQYWNLPFTCTHIAVDERHLDYLVAHSQSEWWYVLLSLFLRALPNLSDFHYI